MTENNRLLSRQKTDYLRGIAILTVVVNHLVIVYVARVGGYGGGMVSFFFILSGFGIYLSLSNVVQTKSWTQTIVSFWKKRMLRIYPLFWIYCFLKLGTQVTLIQLLALDFIKPATQWFVPAILQCYIVAPFFFWLINKLGVKIYSTVLVIGYTALNIGLFSLGVKRVAGISFHNYHGFFFSHILLFGTGFAIAYLFVTKPKIFSNFKVYLVAFLFIFFLHQTTPQTNFPDAINVLEVFFLFFSIFFVYVIINSNAYLPFFKFFQKLGIYSYSIYLFHRYCDKWLQKMGILERYNEGCNLSLVGILFFVILFPLFLACLAYFEEIVNNVVNRNFNFKDITKRYFLNVFGKG